MIPNVIYKTWLLCINSAKRLAKIVMPDLIRHPVPAWVQASAGMTIMGMFVCLAYNIQPAEAAATPSDTPQAGLSIPGTSDGNATAMSDIHDIKPVLALDSGLTWLYWALGALVLIGLLALAWWWWRRRKKPEVAAPTAPVISPEQEAYQALDALAAETGLTPRQFYFHLSAVVRHYTERRFDFPAAEMTTEELLPRVDRLPLNHNLAGELKAFCRLADPIKFADAPAERQQMTRDLVFARDFVRQTTVVAPAENADEVKAPPNGMLVTKSPEQLELKKEIILKKTE